MEKSGYVSDRQLKNGIKIIDLYDKLQIYDTFQISIQICSIKWHIVSMSFHNQPRNFQYLSLKCGIRIIDLDDKLSSNLILWK